jgi:hypothetical protein
LICSDVAGRSEHSGRKDCALSKVFFCVQTSRAVVLLTGSSVYPFRH